MYTRYCKIMLKFFHSALLQACPFVFDLFTEDNEGEIEIVDLLPSTPHIDPALSRLIRERGVCNAVNEGRGQLDTYTFTTPHMTTIAVENKVRNCVTVTLHVHVRGMGRLLLWHTHILIHSWWCNNCLFS